MNIINIGTSRIPIRDNAREALKRNLDTAMRDGPLGVRMRELPMLAKDSEHGKILKGGFGPFGIGQMWVTAQPYHKEDPEWDNLPELAWNGDF